MMIGEIPMPNEVQQLLPEVEKFAEAARVMNRDGVVCGDGGVVGVLEKTNGGKVEVAGRAGDLGQDLATIPAIMAYNQKHDVGYNVEELTGDVVGAYVETHGQFQFHTSDHVHFPDKITDCGDMHGKMSDENYGLDGSQVKKVIEQVQGLAKADESGEVEETTLGGRDHQEKGVLVVTGKTHSLVHWVQDGEGEGMWFVLDPERAKTRRQAVLEHMGYSSEAVEEILAIKAGHDQVTNMRLAKGKHVFGVNVDTENPEVSFMGTVQADGSIK